MSKRSNRGANGFTFSPPTPLFHFIHHIIHHPLDNQMVAPGKSLSSMIATHEKNLDQLLSKYPALLKLERKVGIPKARLVTGAAVLLLAYGLLQIAAPMLVSLVVFGYPAFMTMRALESGQKVEHAMWLSYWVSAGLFQLLDAFTLGGLAQVIPFFIILKLALHIWLAAPQTQGALVVYESVLRPSFKSLLASPQFAVAQDKFASVSSKVAQETKKVTEDLKKNGEELKKAAVEGLSKDD